MDAKTVKTALKNAREAIRQKEFKQALENCKLVLSVDRDNYNALVFFGVAMEGLDQPEQVLKAYKRAIEASPDQLLAWQGLNGFYEKNQSEENFEDHIKVYEKLLSLYENDKDKYYETKKKLGQLLINRGFVDKAKEVYISLAKYLDDVQRRTEVNQLLIDLLSKKKSQSQEEEHLTLSIHKEILMDADSSPCVDERIKQYLMLLLKLKDKAALEEECNELGRKYPKSVFPKELQLLIYLDDATCIKLDQEELESFDTTKIEGALSEIQSLVEDSGISLIAQGFLSMCKKDYLSCKQLVQKGLEKSNLYVCSYLFLGCVNLYLHNYEESQEFCRQGINVLSKKDRLLTLPGSVVATKLKYIIASCLYMKGNEQTLKKALELLLKEENQREEWKCLTCYVYIKLKDITKAEELAKGLDSASIYSTVLHGWIDYSKEKYKEAIERLEVAVDQKPQNSDFNLKLAQCLWQLRNSKEIEITRCFTLFLKAAKLDPFNSEIFEYIGHYYNEIQNDKVRARKCYKKSFDLNPRNETAGAALCDILSSLGEDEEALQLLTSVTNQSATGSCKWAWLRLGLQQMKLDTASEAVLSFQSALRADPSDKHLWECLGDAYIMRGSYTAALKSFTKATELDTESLYGFFQIANIKQILGTLSEAVDGYKIVLEKSQNYVPALKGIAETHLCLAKVHLSQYFNGRARDNCQEALAYLTRAATVRPDFSCLWKLMGDSCNLLKSLSSFDFSIAVPKKLLKKSEEGKDDMCTLSKLELLELGARCYGKALTIRPESSSLWQDLGMNYFYQSENSSGENVKILAEKSSTILKKALALDPKNHEHWNALGVVSCKALNNPGLAQHCFIQSVTVENNNVKAWTNLGTLYLQHDNVELAHKAFKVAQCLDPTYVACWIGQALIADVIGHEEAMDLFRHTTELGNHLEGSMGYGHWVCSMLQDTSKHTSEMYRYSIEKMAAIPAASDALSKYTSREKNNPTAYNMYGILLEHQGLNSLAVKAYGRAVELLQNKEIVKSELCMAKTNYARILCSCSRYKEAIIQYESVGENCLTFEDLCHYGLALYKLSKFKEATHVYNIACEKTEIETEKSHVKAVLGMIAYKQRDIDGTKTALFEGFQLSPPSIHGLMALCVVGVLQSDLTLSMAAIQELLKLEESGTEIDEIIILTASSLISQGKLTEAVRRIQSAVHKYPTKSVLWNWLCEILQRYFPDRGQAVTSSSLVVSLLDGAKSHKDCLCLHTIGRLMNGDCSLKNGSKVIGAAQKSFHENPDSMKNLCILVSAIHSEAVTQFANQSTTDLFSLELVYLEYIIQRENLSSSVVLWSWKQYITCLLYLGRSDAVVEAIEKCKKLFSSTTGNLDTFITTVKAVLSKDTSVALENVVADGTDFYYWQTLVEIFIVNGAMTEVENLLKLCLQKADSTSLRQKQFMSLVKIAHCSFKCILSESGNLEHWKLLFKEASTEVMHLQPDCSAVLYMQGVISLKENTRLARKYFKKILDNENTMNSRTTPYVLSLTRQNLLKICKDSKKDVELSKEILDEAKADQDTDSVKIYNELFESTETVNTSWFDK